MMTLLHQLANEVHQVASDMAEHANHNEQSMLHSQSLVNALQGATRQTGQAIEVIAITMSVYLAISISISLLMNWYNKRIALIER